ncbi:MAG: hypothetical protein C0418_02535 [Coriobacteriaceae bacterium]|nr:hypothetical protein [Coriobacteriaceae bacterium]
MKLTPLDIHHKEFHHAVRGYKESEVDDFLDEVADEYERLFKENIDLSEKLEASGEKVRSYQDIEKTLHNTMLSAQRSAEEIVDKARSEASTVLRDAEIKAKEIIHNALTQKQKVAGELVRIKQAEEDFRARFRGVLDSYSKALGEIKLPDDVTVLMGETDDGVIGEVEVATLEPVPAEAPPVVPEIEPEAPQAVLTITPADLAEDPPVSGFVTGVQLGEVESPEIEPELPAMPEPREFAATTESVGELDSDDIEEID